MPNRLEQPRRWRVVALIAGAMFFTMVLTSAQVASNVGQGARIIPGVNGGEPGHPINPDQKTELAMKIKQPFTVVGSRRPAAVPAVFQVQRP